MTFLGASRILEVQRLQKKVDQDWEGSTVVVSATDQVRGCEPSNDPEDLTSMNWLPTSCSLAATCKQS